MYNNPSGNASQITVGPGILLVGPAGATPTTDMGYIKGGITINIERAQTEIRQGSPQTIIAALVNKEDVMIEFKGIQWNLDNIAFMLGDGATTFVNPTDTLKFGGRPTTNAKAFMFQHRMADGSTLFVDLWKCIPDGSMAIAVNEDDTHELPFKFKAMYAGTTDWAGAALADGTNLCRIRLMRA